MSVAPLRSLVAAVLLVLAGAPLSAWASDETAVKEVPLLPSEFADRASEIRAGLKPGGEYDFVKPKDAAKVEEALDRMQAVLDRGKPLDKLNSGETLRLYNAQERVNSILQQRPQLGILCERRRPLGTHMMKTECKTYAEWKAQADFLDDNDKMRLQQCRGADCQSGN